MVISELAKRLIEPNLMRRLWSHCAETTVTKCSEPLKAIYPDESTVFIMSDDIYTSIQDLL